MVGYAIFNEEYIDLDKENFRENVHATVHETMHSLFFHFDLFLEYPELKNPKKKTNQDHLAFYINGGRLWSRGENLVRAYQEHVGCDNPKNCKFFFINTFEFFC